MPQSFRKPQLHNERLKFQSRTHGNYSGKLFPKCSLASGQANPLSSNISYLKYAFWLFSAFSCLSINAVWQKHISLAFRRFISRVWVILWVFSFLSDHWKLSWFCIDQLRIISVISVRVSLVEGHDSSEDASACMELMIWKIKEDAKVKRWPLTLPPHFLLCDFGPRRWQSVGPRETEERV